jgi:integrase
VRVSKAFQKWELVTTHCARRSFATNLYKSDFPSISIMAITGHKTEEAFLKYIKVTPEEHAKKLREHWDTKHLKVV